MKGITIKVIEAIIGVLVDDTTSFVNDVISSRNALNVLVIFCFISSLKINID